MPIEFDRAYLPATPERLRSYLRKHMTDDLLREIAAVDYGVGTEDNFTGLKVAIETGAYFRPKEGNLYECCLMQGENPLQTLCAAWWLGWFCSGNTNDWILLNNIRGAESLARMLVNSSITLDSEAASASASFLRWLATVDPRPDEDLYKRADKVLAVVEKLGFASTRNHLITDFLGIRPHN